MKNLTWQFIRHASESYLTFSNYHFNIQQSVRSNFEKIKKDYLVKKKRDIRKQRAQFVSLDRYGLPSNTPESFTKKEAQSDIDSAVRFRACLELVYGERSPHDPLFRTLTTLNYSHQDGTVLNHESGVTIKMEPFAWIETGCQPDRISMNPHIILPKLPSINPAMLDDKQKSDLAKIYKTYDFPSQIRSEMSKLGLKKTEYLDEVEELIDAYAITDIQQTSNDN